MSTETSQPEGDSKGNGEGPNVSWKDIKCVQNLIERCLQKFMTQAEIIAALQVEANVDPPFTCLVWQKLEEQNPEFFFSYNTRLKIRDQIVAFNYMVDQQAHLIQKVSMGIGAGPPPSHPPPPPPHMGFPQGHHPMALGGGGGHQMVGHHPGHPMTAGPLHHATPVPGGPSKNIPGNFPVIVSAVTGVPNDPQVVVSIPSVQVNTVPPVAPTVAITKPETPAQFSANPTAQPAPASTSLPQERWQHPQISSPQSALTLQGSTTTALSLVSVSAAGAAGGHSNGFGQGEKASSAEMGVRVEGSPSDGGGLAVLTARPGNALAASTGYAEPDPIVMPLAGVDVCLEGDVNIDVAAAAAVAAEGAAAVAEAEEAVAKAAVVEVGQVVVSSEDGVEGGLGQRESGKDSVIAVDVGGGGSDLMIDVLDG